MILDVEFRAIDKRGLSICAFLSLAISNRYKLMLSPPLHFIGKRVTIGVVWLVHAVAFVCVCVCVCVLQFHGRDSCLICCTIVSRERCTWSIELIPAETVTGVCVT